MIDSSDERAISFRSLRKVYGDGTVAVDDVDLDVPRGQFCVLLGSSGAGKSTLLRAVNGLTDPTAGSVTVDGLPVQRGTLTQVRRRVGMIHQAFNLSPRLPVHDNICAGASGCLPVWRNLSKRFGKDLSRKACRLLHRVGLDERHLYRRASQLSGGQQQRVGIARAFIIDPSVILADEPVASLDPNTSAEVLELLRDASRERGCTVLCSLHQLDLARSFADRIIGMSAGRVVFDGAPGALTETAIAEIYRPISATKISAVPETALRELRVEPVL